MSSFSLNNNLAGCLPVIDDAVKYFGKNTPLGRAYEEVGALVALKSDFNTRGFEQLSSAIRTNATAGKKVKVELLADSPMCFSIAPTTFNCASTPTPYTNAMNMYEWELETRWAPVDGNGDEQALKVSFADYEKYCSIDHADKFKELVLSYDYQFIKKVNEEILNAMFNTVLPSMIKTIPLYFTNQLTGQKVLNEDWTIQLEEYITAAGLNSSDYWIVGGVQVKYIQNKYAMMGVETPFPMFYDRKFDSVFTGSAFLLVPRGYFQFVTFNYYEGMRTINTPQIVKFNKSVPVTGSADAITIDYIMEQDLRCETYTYLPSLYAEVVSAIPGTCNDSDESGLFLIKDCNATPFVACP